MIHNQNEVWWNVYERVLWWVKDAAFKPPEIDWDWYYKCMANDIADTAVGEELGTLTATDRLDPK